MQRTTNLTYFPPEYQQIFNSIVHVSNMNNPLTFHLHFFIQMNSLTHNFKLESNFSLGIQLKN